MEKRVDIEEANNLAEKMTEKSRREAELYRRLNAMNASYPFLNGVTGITSQRKDLCASKTGK